jgi:hypothetical protein
MPPVRLILPLLLIAALAMGVRGWVAGQSPPVPVEPPARRRHRPRSGRRRARNSGSPAADRPGAAAVAAFAAHLDAAAAQAGDLVALGETKSRNLLAITAGQRRMSGLLDETDAFLVTATLPEEADPAVAAYREGAAAVRAAWTEAQAGFVRLDWERVRRADGGARRGQGGAGAGGGLLE